MALEDAPVLGLDLVVASLKRMFVDGVDSIGELSRVDNPFVNRPEHILIGDGQRSGLEIPHRQETPVIREQPPIRIDDEDAFRAQFMFGAQHGEHRRRVRLRSAHRARPGGPGVAACPRAGSS